MTSSFMSKLVVAFPATSFALGLWQVYRLRTTDLIEEREAKFFTPPVEFPLDPSPETLKELEFSPVKLTGKFHHDRELYLSFRWGKLPTGTSQEVGYHVLTPLERPNGEKVLINRGWVPLANKDPSTRAEGQVQGMVEVNGLVRPGDASKPSYFSPENLPDRGQWHWLDLPALAKAADTKPILIDALPEPANPGGMPVGGVTPVNFKNDHLGYAITWFSLAFLSSFAILRYRQPHHKTLMKMLR